MSVSLSPALSAFLAQLQKDTLPGIWAKGIALGREGAVQLDHASEQELTLRVLLKDRPVSPKVSLWLEDQDAYCDCGDRNELCAHIAACAVALKAGITKQAPAAAPEEASAAASGRGAYLAYRLTRIGNALSFDRWILHAGREILLSETLVAHMGGIASGRIVSPPLPATREDFSIDAALQRRRHILEPAILRAIFPFLAQTGGVTLDGQPIQVSAVPTGMRARLDDFPGGGFRLTGEMASDISEVFSNGAALCGDTLKPLQLPSLNPTESAALSSQGRLFRSPPEILTLVTEVLPSLEAKLRVEIITQKLPQPRAAHPHISLSLESLKDGELLIIPSLQYEQKPAANEIWVPDPFEEKALTRKLQSELQLNPGQAVRLSGLSALEVLSKIQASPKNWKVEGDGLQRHGITAALEAKFSVNDSLAQPWALEFRVQGAQKTADPYRVFQAWQQKEAFVPLLEGGWAPLPLDWLNQYGDRIQALLTAKNLTPTTVAPTYFLPSLSDLALEMGTPLPARLQAMKEALDHHEHLPQASLPADLKADLRTYQKQGVDWLCFLRDQSMGALLADDMGLGKTLQALCALRGRTLIVAPTSVLSSWTSQTESFRPGLKLSTYYGPKRALDAEADIILTSYAVLRLDRELLAAETWKTIILDEAQTIKNPDSQVARAVHSLPGEFRIALSGTPIENRLEDLWSQFQFVNPGLLGTRDAFLENFSDYPARLRTRIKPFLLRRLKKEVAPELPPRTETVLHCELNQQEQELYNSILAASRPEVLKTLESGGGVFAALEMLLRLRQTCCHPALVPGGASGEQATAASSKLELLLETLDESIALGHRALVFSQWTSLLDLIEPLLNKAGHSFCRLDGSTQNREAVVKGFQNESGPSVMLISLKAGGVGLTLTAADHVFILDPWWNPATEDQAADRAHRIGQENPVLIHRLVAKGTVEDRILALQKQKQALAAAVLDGANGAAALTRQDLLDLISP
ncbi:DEAD/DEAH box helicase [Bdellovibrionota bacterium FG-1]